MTPIHIVENTFNPSQFAAATSAGVVGVVASKGDKTFVIILLALLALGLGFVAWRHYLDAREDEQ